MNLSLSIGVIRFWRTCSGLFSDWTKGCEVIMIDSKSLKQEQRLSLMLCYPLVLNFYYDGIAINSWETAMIL